MDWDLTIRHGLEAGFDPVTMSLDEAGRIYLVVKIDGRNVLWLVTPEGGLLYAFEFQPGSPPPDYPPIIAYDHSVYLVSGAQILALGPDGKLNWTRAANSTVKGGFVTPDQLLVVTEGDSITSWNAQGRRTVLFSTGGDMLQTPPVLAPAGELLAASETRLYCLSALPATRR
jgi:hypothetical protein